MFCFLISQSCLGYGFQCHCLFCVLEFDQIFVCIGAREGTILIADAGQDESVSVDVEADQWVALQHKTKMMPLHRGLFGHSKGWWSHNHVCPRNSSSTCRWARRTRQHDSAFVPASGVYLLRIISARENKHIGLFQGAATSLRFGNQVPLRCRACLSSRTIILCLASSRSNGHSHQ